jgi:hypothetical protein
VQSRIAHVNRKLGAARLGGMNRTPGSRSYLFSGLLVCAECKSRLVIISGQGKRGYVRYGCPSHRYRGVCDNAITIRQDRLEAQLLAALEQRLANPQLTEYVLIRFQEELKKRLAELQRQTGGLESLRQERTLLKAQAQRIVDAVAAIGHSSALLCRLTAVEGKIADLDSRIESHKPVDVAATLDDLREFVYRNVTNLRDLLHQDASKSKLALARHVGQLILKPKRTPTGPVYEVSGGVDLMPDNTTGSDVMLVVARDGIGPPTAVDSTQVAVSSSHQTC